MCNIVIFYQLVIKNNNNKNIILVNVKHLNVENIQKNINLENQFDVRINSNNYKYGTLYVYSMHIYIIHFELFKALKT